MELNEHGGINPIDVWATVTYQDGRWNITIKLDHTSAPEEEIYVECVDIKDAFQAMALSVAEHVLWAEQDKVKQV